MKIKLFDDAFDPIMENGRQKEMALDPSWVKERKGLPLEAIRFAEYLGRYLVGPKLVDDRKSPGKQMLIFSGGMSTSQVRNFFGAVRILNLGDFAGNYGAFAMLRPRLAFARVRATKDNLDNRIKDFEQAVLLLMDNVENGEDFQNFVDFLEATVAYHKANGGKN
ncbi:MAG: type III-A CRISPR-associated protein Csm2 [Saprospiraceae bacterium]